MPPVETKPVGPTPAPIGPKEQTLPSFTAPIETTPEQFEQAGLEVTGESPTGLVAPGIAAPTKEPTQITSEKAATKTAENQQVLSDIQAQELQAKLDTAKTQLEGIRKAEPVVSAVDQRLAKETAKEEDPELSDLQGKVDIAQNEIDTEADTAIGLLDEMAKRFEATTAQQMSSISSIFGRRREQAKALNKNRIAGLGVMGLRSGRTRFAGEIQSGIISAEEQALIARLSAIDNDEKQAMFAAQLAADNKQFGLLNQKIGLIKEARREKFQVAQDLNNLALQEQQLLQNRIDSQREEMRFEQEQDDRQMAELAAGLLGASDADINATADQLGIDPVRLKSAVQALSREDRLAELDVRGAELGVEGARLSNVQQRQKIDAFQAAGGKGKPPSSTQFQAATFATRIGDADIIIGNLEDKFIGSTARFGGFLPKEFKTDERKQFEQAEENLINSILRRESGAAISDPEFAKAREQYIPQAGDDETTLAQKRRNRKVVFTGLKLESGDAFGQIEEALGGGAEQEETFQFQSQIEGLSPEQRRQLEEEGLI